jgi:hypothetical protein
MEGSTAVNDKTTVTEKLNDKTTAKPVSVEMPDLIDTSEMDLLGDGGVSKEKDTDTTTTSATVDLLGDELLPTRDEGSKVIANPLYNQKAWMTFLVLCPSIHLYQRVINRL